MKLRWHWLTGALFALALVYDLFLWGGLSHSPQLGPTALQAARREVSLASIYLLSGRPLLAASGLSGVAAAHAEARFAALQRAVLDNPPAALDTLTRRMPATVRGAYLGAPLLLLAFALAWWRRPRGVHLVRGR